MAKNNQIVTINDGYKVTVGDIIGNPMWLPQQIIQLAAGAFIEESLLRDAGGSINGLVAYEKSRPLYFDSDPVPLAEFEEIPMAAGSKGEPAIAVGQEYGAGIRVSQRMIDQNLTGEVIQQMTQLVNTFARARSRALRKLLQDPAIPTLPASAGWNTPTGNPRGDFAQAAEIIASASVSGDILNEDAFGFSADTTVLHTSLTPVLMNNDSFLSVYKANDTLGQVAPNYTGTLERQILGLTAMQSRNWPTDRVLVCERGTLGFYSDSKPLWSRAFEEQPLTQSWVSTAGFNRTMGIDQPLAACWITGVIQ